MLELNSYVKFSKLLRLISEKNKNTTNLVPDSDEARKGRAEDVKILSISKSTPSTAPKDKPLNKGWKLYQAELLSKEKTENRKHSAYVALDKYNNVKDVYCSCADFQFLWRYSLTQDDMAAWETYPEYKDIETHGPHTKEPSNVTNPNFDKKLCKHLIKLFDTLDI